MVYAMIAIGAVGFVVWRTTCSFLASTSTPSLFHGCHNGDRGADRHQDLFLDRDHVGGSIELKTPMLWAIGSSSCSPLRRDRRGVGQRGHR